MELTQIVFLISLICFSVATVSIFLVGSNKDIIESEKKRMDDPFL
tara:strand:- start:677 stop:811 length:135 start_codon:yes stop_codon:yes gene_type:complete